jgi:hypothetical protein
MIKPRPVILDTIRFSCPLKVILYNRIYFCENNMIFDNRVMTKRWLDALKVKNYTINEDLTVDVNGNVNLARLNLPEIRVQFGMINGNFDCSYNELTTLKGTPYQITGAFDCNKNKLTTLENGPKKTWYYTCTENQLISLLGAPEEVTASFNCSHNLLKNLDYLPKKIGDTLKLSYNNITSIEQLINCQIGVALEVDNNQLTHYKGLPLNLKKFSCYKNEIEDYSELMNLYDLTDLYCKDFLHIGKQECVEFNSYKNTPQDIQDYLDVLRAHHEKNLLNETIIVKSNTKKLKL